MGAPRYFDEAKDQDIVSMLLGAVESIRELKY
jgi:hypothetical protein